MDTTYLREDERQAYDEFERGAFLGGGHAAFELTISRLIEERKKNAAKWSGYQIQEDGTEPPATIPCIQCGKAMPYRVQSNYGYGEPPEPDTYVYECEDHPDDGIPF